MNYNYDYTATGYSLCTYGYSYSHSLWFKLYIWRFPNMRVPPNQSKSILSSRVFHEINRQVWAVPLQDDSQLYPIMSPHSPFHHQLTWIQAIKVDNSPYIHHHLWVFRSILFSVVIKFTQSSSPSRLAVAVSCSHRSPAPQAASGLMHRPGQCAHQDLEPSGDSSRNIGRTCWPYGNLT